MSILKTYYNNLYLCIMNYEEQFNMLKELGLIPQEYDWWTNGKYSMEITFLNGLLLIKNMKKNE